MPAIKLPADRDPKNEKWNQAHTLTPLPYPKDFYLATLVDGLTLGDKVTQNLSHDELGAIHRTGFLECVSTKPIPEWVDRDAVRRGQKLHMTHFYCFLTSLCSGLLHGLVMSRFAEVLWLAGYTKDDWTTYVRYRDTATAISSWMEYDLFDFSSVGFRNVMRVRAMHERARRLVANRWQKRANGEEIGVPLCQYDMALVQMAFCALTLSVLQEECQMTLTEQEKHDYCHLWRYLGYLLGIEDKYNIAKSYEISSRCFDEFLAMVPYLHKEARPSSVLLVQACVRSFGTYTLASREFYAGLLFGAVRADVEFDTTWVNMKAPPKVYSKKVYDKLNPDNWFLPAFFWHFCFACYIHYQILYPNFSRFMETVSQIIPQKFHF